MKCKWHLCNNEVTGNKVHCSTKCKNKVNVTIWTKKRKAFLVEYKGGKCELCDYDKCVGALHLHHKNPKNKSFGFATNEARSKTLKELRVEADKCILVCANCHAEEHEKFMLV